MRLQVEGVRFLYSSIMGLGEAGHTGCILADAMGLGKTLQVMATLTSPYAVCEDTQCPNVCQVLYVGRYSLSSGHSSSKALRVGLLSTRYAQTDKGAHNNICALW